MHVYKVDSCMFTCSLLLDLVRTYMLKKKLHALVMDISCLWHMLVYK